MVELELVGVRVEMPANTPLLLLRETGGRQRLMPIYIGNPGATAIHYAIEACNRRGRSPTTCSCRRCGHSTCSSATW